MGLFPVAIGGGHDLTFPFVRGVIEHWKDRTVTIDAGVYFDAHLDVRENTGSGMSFRRLIEDCAVKHLEVRGANPMVNAREHWRWFLTHGGTDGDGRSTTPGRNRFVSVDLDVLDAPVAPGVSAPNPAGWTVDRLSEQVRALGADPGVRCLDIMELNPTFDIDGRTARAAVHVFLSFLRGLAARVPA
jgi:arginase family enzyme